MEHPAHKSEKLNTSCKQISGARVANLSEWGNATYYMRKLHAIYFSIIFIMAFVMQAKSQKTVSEKYYDNGKIWSRVVKNIDSNYIEYSYYRLNQDYCVSTGVLLRDTFVSNGPCSCFYSSGTIYSISNFNYGKQDGRVVNFHLNGSLKAEYFKRDGIMCGLYKEYYSNGNIKVKGRYKNNVRIKKWYYFYNNATVQAKGKYYKKFGMVKPFSINLSDSSCYTENLLPPFEFANEYNQLMKGVWKLYDCKGVLKKKIKF